MKESTRTLSEYDSKQLLREYSVPMPRERLASSADEAVRAATEIGLPVALKLCGEGIAHKTERDLVRLSLSDAKAVRAAAIELLERARPEDGDVALLVAEMLRGRRELIVGLTRDPSFGACVMLGLGGILAEAVGDVAFALAPIDAAEARRMIGSLQASHLLTQEFRGDPAVDLDALAGVLVALSRLADERPDVESVDLNPVMLCGDRPIAADALVELREPAAAADLDAPAAAASDRELLERFRPLFHPRGIAVAGVSSHPGKFGFVAMHNLLRFGYSGKLFPLKPDGAQVLGRETWSHVSQLPEGAADLVFVCTPNRVNVELLRDCAKQGVRAAFITSAGRLDL